MLIKDKFKVAWLVANGQEYKNFRLRPDGVKEFYFENNDEVRNLIHNYSEGNIKLTEVKRILTSLNKPGVYQQNAGKI